MSSYSDKISCGWLQTSDGMDLFSRRNVIGNQLKVWIDISAIFDHEVDERTSSVKKAVQSDSDHGLVD